ncbi:MAG: hypothetical protein ABI548_05775 [Polyangiaceae bacterium]
MRSIWIGIAPGLTTTRVVAMAGPSETILKAQLSKDPVPPGTGDANRGDPSAGTDEFAY